MFPDLKVFCFGNANSADSPSPRPGDQAKLVEAVNNRWQRTAAATALNDNSNNSSSKNKKNGNNDDNNVPLVRQPFLLRAPHL